MTDYYLATDGSDGDPGTQSAPFGTLGQLLGTLTAGDTGYVRGGTHYPTGFADGSAQHGTESEPIRLTAYDGESVVFDFSNDSYGALRLWDCSYWELSDFTVQNSPSYGVYCFGGTHHCTIENVVVDGSGGDPNTSGAGIYFYQAPDNLVRNCVSRNNYDPASGGGNADGFVGESAAGTIFEDCVAHGNSDDGFDLWRGENEVIRRCVAYENGFDPDGNPAGDGNGFKLGGGATSGGHRIERCVSYRNASRGFHYNEANIPVELYNNTAFDNPTNFWFAEVEHVLRNNLAFDGTLSLGSAVDDQSNSWNLGIDSPSFQSTDPSSDDFLLLSPDSPAIDAGVDVGLDFQGSAPDLGAYETGETASDDDDDGETDDGSTDDGSTGDGTTQQAALRVATAGSDGSVAFESGTLRAFDGGEWVQPRVTYHDGSSFVEVGAADGSDGGTGDDGGSSGGDDSGDDSSGSDDGSDGSDGSDDGSGDGSTSDPSVVEDFESGDLTPYQGDTASFALTTERAAGGNYSLVGAGGGSDWESLLAVNDGTRAIPYGSTFRVRVWLSDASDCAIVRFGVAGSSNWIGAGYNSNEGGLQLSESVGGSWSQIGNGWCDPAVGEWMEFEIAWGVGGDDLVELTVYDADGTAIGSGSATASDHRGDEGVGFEYTVQYGGTGPVYFDELRLV